MYLTLTYGPQTTGRANGTLQTEIVEQCYTASEQTRWFFIFRARQKVFYNLELETMQHVRVQHSVDEDALWNNNKIQITSGDLQ